MLSPTTRQFRTKQKVLRPEFVELIPDNLEEGVLYISIHYSTASHKCACGCGEEVVTPIKPTDWSLTWNGEAATLDPSIGNWSQPCLSHYWIIENRIIWAKKWNPSKIKSNRIKDSRERARYYDQFCRSE